MIVARPVVDGEDLAGQVLLVRVRCRAVHKDTRLACVRLVDSPRFGGPFQAHVIDVAAIAGVEIDPPSDEALVPR